MQRRRVLLGWLFANIIVLAYGVGRFGTQPRTEIRSQGQWVEVYYGGDLVAEFQPTDGATYDILAEALTYRP